MPVVSANGARLAPNGVKSYNSGDSVTLTCLAEGAPRPIYEWSRMLAQGGFTTIQPSSNVRVSDGVLR
mgnify:CR=1 FL=1